MAAKKTAAKKAAVSTVSKDTTGGVPGLDPELARIREEELAKEPETKETPAGEPGIDPALVKQRDAARKAEGAQQQDGTVIRGDLTAVLTQKK